jgi:hypothetical protein
MAALGKTLGNEAIFGRTVMDKDHISIAAPCHIQGLPSAKRDYLHCDTARLTELWQ